MVYEYFIIKEKRFCRGDGFVGGFAPFVPLYIPLGYI